MGGNVNDNSAYATESKTESDFVQMSLLYANKLKYNSLLLYDNIHTYIQQLLWNVLKIRRGRTKKFAHIHTKNKY